MKNKVKSKREPHTDSRKKARFFGLWAVLTMVALIAAGLLYHQLFGSVSRKNNRIDLPVKMVGSQSTESVDLGGGEKMEFILIPAGSFMMGSSMDDGDGDETPVHKVIITQPFYMGKFEVTQEQWRKVMGDNPSKFKGLHRPVDAVSWNDCQKFLMKLQERTKRKYALPTEAQWEFACRAGTKSYWNFGNREDSAGDYGWLTMNSGNVSHPVGLKKSNKWGLYDMYGNVWEWCADWYENPYSRNSITDPAGPPSGVSRVLRGGAWGDSPVNARSAYRNCMGPQQGHEGTGFRCVMLVENR